MHAASMKLVLHFLYENYPAYLISHVYRKLPDLFNLAPLTADLSKTTAALPLYLNII